MFGTDQKGGAAEQDLSPRWLRSTCADTVGLLSDHWRNCRFGEVNTVFRTCKAYVKLHRN